jgi:predicted nucleic acid-binding Zn ribbon protein
MDLSVYKNQEGTYTSPKNGKKYKSEKALRSHLHFRRTERFHNFKNLNTKKVNCKFCERDVGFSNISNHENGCYLNPKNLRHCKVCNKPIKNFKKSKGTCSKSCANTYFKSGEGNGNWKQDAYQSTCFLHHGKKCVVCGESNIVEAHHLDEDKTNNDPSNLIPLCPNHHQYWHSRFRHLVEEKVYSYINEWKKKLSLV